MKTKAERFYQPPSSDEMAHPEACKKFPAEGPMRLGKAETDNHNSDNTDRVASGARGRD